MPCRDGGPSLEDIRKADLAMAKKRKEEKEYKERLDLTTRLLCGILRKMEDVYPNKTWNPLNWGDSNKELIEWWDRHKKQDQERLRREQADKLAKKAKLRAEIKKMQKELENL